MTERPVTIEGGRRLVGMLHAPQAAGERGAGVIFVHGWSGYRIGPHRMFVRTARAMAERGYHCLRFDLSGRGDSEGEAGETDLDMMVDDALAAARFLRETIGVRKLFPLGICSGGNVTLGAASLDKSFAGLILWSTPLFAPAKVKTDEVRRRGRLFSDTARKLLRRETYAKLFDGKVDWRTIRRNLLGRGDSSQREGRNLKDSRRDVLADLDGYHGPALFVYGSRDHDAVGAPEFYRQYCLDHDIPAAFHIIEGANHSYYSRPWEQQVIDVTLGWLDATA